ncbi:MAG: hypothetical protein C5B59_19995 [Bacteroidetes bacterium]|nr:MAG: hypothetical protein C5B59_19995 [Bacteroidota bacterium]
MSTFNFLFLIKDYMSSRDFHLTTVGTEETRLIAYNGTPYSVTSMSVTLKNNSGAYNRLKKMDLRLLLDANYHWKRFATGLRYQGKDSLLT